MWLQHQPQRGSHGAGSPFVFHNRMKESREKRPDVLDVVFGWAERAFCPTSLINKAIADGEDEDTLDYVFEHVESFVCREQEERAEPDVLYIENGLARQHVIFGQGDSMTRDNSLIEERPSPNDEAVRSTTKRTIKPLGHQGDVIDYVFEHVESFVCSEEMPTAEQYQRDRYQPDVDEFDDMVYRAAKHRIETIRDPEDEIQVYFRPKRLR